MATVVAPDLLKDAALIVDVCFSVEDGDVVTIICDDDHTAEAAAVGLPWEATTLRVSIPT